VFVRPLTVPYPPEIPLQNVQWHCETRMNGSVTSKRTPPQRHLPWSGVIGVRRAVASTRARSARL
jgi:hypothetical protein